MLRASSGDRQALASLSDLYGPDVYRLALYILRLEEEARDAASDIFTRLFASPGIIPQENFRAWLMRVSYNHCRDILRRKATLGHLLPKIYSRMAGATDPGPEQAVVDAAEQAEVRRAIASLPLQERVIVFFRYYQQLSYSEISAVLNIPEATVGTRLHRAREKLRTMLEQGKGGAEHGAVRKSI